MWAMISWITNYKAKTDKLDYINQKKKKTYLQQSNNELYEEGPTE